MAYIANASKVKERDHPSSDAISGIAIANVRYLFREFRAKRGGMGLVRIALPHGDTRIRFAHNCHVAELLDTHVRAY